MDGIHDLGGRHGFGAVQREADEPVFHERWEARVFAIVGAARAAGALRNTDQFRHAIERIDPVAYLTHGYYGRWLGGLETLLLEAGVVDAATIAARLAEFGGDPGEPSAARPAAVPDRVTDAAQASSRRRAPAPPQFAVGTAVRTRVDVRARHTRLPAYARGRTGTVIAWHDGWVFPDSNAHGAGENPQHLYTVEFTGSSLWGNGAEPDTSVSLDLFESYLEAVGDE
ncbi:MAG: nitrile hydratase subunit beta [Pseudomonadales bacterium]